MIADTRPLTLPKFNRYRSQMTGGHRNELWTEMLEFELAPFKTIPNLRNAPRYHGPVWQPPVMPLRKPRPQPKMLSWWIAGPLWIFLALRGDMV